MKRYEAEANVAAAKIRDMVNSGFKVTDRSTGKLRDVEYGDFCIILRKMAGGCGKAYSDALERAGIPFSAGFSDGFFNSVEVSTMICVLTAVDNVLNDVELAGAMASPVFGFSADELASIRIRRKDAPLYTAVKSCADNGDEKCSSFLKLLEQFRRKAAVSPAHMLIRYIYDVTGYLYAVSAMENGVHRRANLLLLLEYASSFERTGQRGLSSFVRYISRLMENGEDLNASTAGSAGQNSVKLMTIHKSKGLEFPVCILGCLCAQTGGGKNKTEDIILLHPELGIGMKRRDEELHNTFDTIQMPALRSRIAQDSISEEMRCLYVAMTRAREHLICMIETGSVEKMAVQLSAKMAGGRELSPFFIRSCKSYGEWITASVMRRREAADVFPYLADGETVTSESPVEITLAEPQIQETTHDDAICDAEPDGELMEELRKKIESGYRYEGLSWIEAKKSASDFTMHGQERAYFAMKKPSFANTDGVPAAERGTAMHKFMQLCDYKRLREDVESEIMRLMDMGALTEREAGSVDRFSAQSFADSSLMERIINSPSVMREKSFTVLLDARFLYGPEAPEGEEILIQGAADVVFEEGGGIVIADYKTDRIRDEQKLTGMYRKQLEIYGAAFEKITGLKVKEKLIYSFFLNRELPV